MSTELKYGMIVTLEGMDGCGKTTQARELVKGLQDMGLEVVHVKEPGGSVDADKIRKLLLEDISDDVHPGVEAMLFMAAKIDLYQRVVKPALERKAVVVSERGWYSMLAYQGGAFDPRGEMALQDLRIMSPHIGGPTNNEVPSIQILLRQSLEKTRERLAKRAEKLDHFEVKPDAFYEGVHSRFDHEFGAGLNMWTMHPFFEQRAVVDVETGTVDEISTQILAAVKQHIRRVHANLPMTLTSRMSPDTQLKV